MADSAKNPAEYYPQALNGNGFHGGDHESLRSLVEEEKRRKRIKWAVYIAAFSVFQVMVILVFALVVMKVRSPKFRVGELQIQTLDTNRAAPSFDMRFVAPIRIKNTNFGPYKFDASTVNFTYGGVVVGQAVIPGSKANFKSTKKINVEVSLSSRALSGANSGLEAELSKGVITLGSHGKMNGKVTMMLVMKKKKSAEMNCNMEIEVASRTVKSLECK
ncbi:hypothetical protein MLD38_020954 [Melastoma candidum]|uniref:Uncharacterized protein n=1 Tax=Melastoma candidum TaxID=119954 RepID=A0ACB9QFI2_9MYRT|nr:hypothetical protein MLD38_020954 [Melastoma candidum]